MQQFTINWNKLKKQTLVGETKDLLIFYWGTLRIEGERAAGDAKEINKKNYTLTEAGGRV